MVAEDICKTRRMAFGKTPLGLKEEVKKREGGVKRVLAQGEKQIPREKSSKEGREKEKWVGQPISQKTGVV